MWAVEITYQNRTRQRVRGFPTEEAAWDYCDLWQPQRPDIRDMWPIEENEPDGYDDDEEEDL